MRTNNQKGKEFAGFASFAKGESIIRKGITGNCVIYTRVSTKEQTKGMSLETQRKDCEQYAVKNDIPILGHFGGTYESAKTDERNEFNRMLKFVRNSKEKISIIIVYSTDRFSRSGANAIYIADQLKQQSIAVYAVTQPADTTTSSGRFQQNMQFIFSEYENQLRREKCMSGTKERLLQGVWCTVVPTGYDVIKRTGELKQIKLNAKGKLIRYGFELKATGMTNESVREILRKKGLQLSNQRISAMFRNPFYCGLIAHKLLGGMLVEGIQEKAVSKDLFLKVNGILAGSHKSGYTIDPENEEIPLKRFLKCENCGRFLRAYKAYKNKKYYYKCCTLGCCCNKRADELHDRFREMMGNYILKSYDEGLLYLIKQQMVVAYNKAMEGKEDESIAIDVKLDEINAKLNRLEERYVMEEITRDMYEKYAGKLREERIEIEAGLAKMGKGVSNLDVCIQSAIDLSMKLATVWNLSDYSGKQRLQFLLFPEGIYYNRKNEECRTPKVNEVFCYMSSLQRVWEQKKDGNINSNLDVPASVARSGIEPETFGL